MAALAAVLVSACGSGEQVVDNTSGRQQVAAIRAAVADTAAQPADVAAVAHALNDFAAGVFAEISREKAEEANVFVSPASIQQVLLLMLAGTDGRVHDQLREALHLDLPEDRMYAATTALWRNVEKADYTFENTNWGILKDTFELNPDYVDLVGEHFGADFRNDSFADPEALAAQINSAVAERTHGMITELLTPEMLDNPGLFLVLLNAVYFKGDWVVPFDPAVEGEFTTSTGQRVRVPMMSRDDVASYVRADGYTAVNLPYQGGARMLVVVPDSGRFDEVARSLTGKRLAEIAAAAEGGAPTSLTMPKFEFTTAQALDLEPAIRALGAPGLFDPSPDWGPLLTHNSQQVSVDFLVHKAAIKVDELGTEASGATAGGIEASSAQIPDAPPIVVDRPFLVGIQDTATGATLFTGRIGDPTQTS
jgi:serpin B